MHRVLLNLIISEGVVEGYEVGSSRVRCGYCFLTAFWSLEVKVAEVLRVLFFWSR